MPQDHSFDIVSKVNLTELNNAVVQAQKELATRFDFKGSRAAIQYDPAEGTLKLMADHSMQMNSVVDLLQNKMVKRGVPIQAIDWGTVEELPSGIVKQQAKLRQGIPSEKAKEISKVIKEMGFKVQPRIEGDAVRVYGKQLDDLQAVIQAVRNKNFGVPVQVENYR